MERVGKLGADAAELAMTSEAEALAPERQASPVCPNLGSAACAACGGCPLMMMRPPSSSEEAPGKQQPVSPIDQLRRSWQVPESATSESPAVLQPITPLEPEQKPKGRGVVEQPVVEPRRSFRKELMDDTVPAVFVKVEQSPVVPQNTAEETPGAPPLTEQPAPQKVSSISPSEHHEPENPSVIDQAPLHTTITPEKPPQDTAPAPAAKSEQVTPEPSPSVRIKPEISAETPVRAAESIIAKVTIPPDADVSHAPQPAADPTLARSVQEVPKHSAIMTPAPSNVVHPVVAVPERPVSVEGGEIADEKPVPITVQRESVSQIPHEPDAQQASDDVVSESSFPALPDETIIQSEEPTIYHTKKEMQPVVESDEQPEVIVIKNEETPITHETPVIRMSERPKEFVPPVETVPQITNASKDADTVTPCDPPPEPPLSQDPIVWQSDVVHTVVRDEQNDPPRDPVEDEGILQRTEQVAARQSERVIEDGDMRHQKKVTTPYDAPEVTIDETMEMSDVLTPLFDLNSTPAPTIAAQPAGLRAVLAALGFATLVVLRLRSAQRMDPAQQG